MDTVLWCVSTWACLFDFFQWPFRSYIRIVYVSRSSNTAITPVWAGLTLWDLWATVWFNNMQVLTLTLILSLGPCLYLLTCLTFSFLPLITSKKHTHAHTRIMQEKVSSFLKPKQHFPPPNKCGLKTSIDYCPVAQSSVVVRKLLKPHQ